jgi:hypothetical protein
MQKKKGKRKKKKTRKKGIVQGDHLSMQYT